MPSYRRWRQPGASYFFTVALDQPGSELLIREVNLLRHCVHAMLIDSPMRIDAAVILPDHLHMVWTLPAGDSDYPKRWKRIKSEFTRRSGLFGQPNASKRRKGEKGLWQRRYWEHLIRDEHDFARHVEYCWYNPVLHGYVKRAVDWRFSSFHRELANGVVKEDWGTDVGWVKPTDTGYFGEPISKVGCTHPTGSPSQPAHLRRSDPRTRMFPNARSADRSCQRMS